MRPVTVQKETICAYKFLATVTPTPLTHWGRVTHICVSKLPIIGSNNGLAPGRHQIIIWTNDGLLLIGPLGTNFSEILIGIQTFSFKKMHLKMSSAKWRPVCLGLNVLNQINEIINSQMKANNLILSTWKNDFLSFSLLMPASNIKVVLFGGYQ